MNSPKETPMMAQFNAVKEQFPDSILFFRMGDFYEMFSDDAVIAAKVLGITLTSRNKNSENQTPMCGIPHHSHRQYLLKLIKAGYKVAICDQLEDPALAKGLVKRGVTRVVSAATVIDAEEILEADNNFLVAIYLSPEGVYFVGAADVSTGEVYMTSCTEDNAKDVVNGFSPKEIISSSPLSPERFVCNITVTPALSISKATKYVMDQYSTSSKESLGIDDERFVFPLSMLFAYVSEALLSVSFSRPILMVGEDRLILDHIAARTLELTDSTAGRSVYSVLNHTKTPMGARTLKRWLTLPTRNIGIINARLAGVGYFTSHWGMAHEMRKILSSLYDIERISTRISSQRVTPKELLLLKESITDMPLIADMIESTGVVELAELTEGLQRCSAIGELINQSIHEDPPQTIKDGDIIKTGYNKHVDEYRETKTNSRQTLAKMEAELKNSTGINQLKISFNKVFGYYIEVSKGNLSKVPDYFERKQTLVNAERFVTPELKELENNILNAEERLSRIEYEIFCSIRDMVAESADMLRKIGKNIGQLDTILSFATIAVLQKYCKPTVVDSDIIDIRDARHPVVEVESKELFIANDILLNNTDSRLLMITGPNMAGKSTYIRTVALVVLLAHIGSFVPASSATVGLVDRIFTRIGASDNISKGESTFMVEMVETANILANATPKSLIILDEIGRGTSTFDGVSIAWAVSEHILNKVRAKTLFATHYHELTDIAKGDNGAKNYTVSIEEQGGEIIFLRKIIPGYADKSYGIYVAKLAGLPTNVVERASVVLGELEAADMGGTPKGHHIKGSQSDVYSNNTRMEVIVKPMLIFDEEHPAVEKLKTLDINQLSPMDALRMLNSLKELVQ